MVFPPLTKFLLKNIDSVFITGLGGLIFWFIIQYVPNSDIQAHAELLHYYHRGLKTFPPNFLYYGLLELFSLGTAKLNAILLASGIVLTLALSAKYIISKKIILEFITLRGVVVSERLKHRISIILASSLLFLSAIPDYYNLCTLHKYYLGRMVPNVWHNSTTIAVFPFALWLFWEQYKLLISKEKASLLQLLGLSLLVIVNCLIKPSFIFVYIPITGLILLFKFGFTAFKTFLKYSIPVLTGIVIIIGLQFLIFQLQLGLLQETGSKIVWVRAFSSWEYLIPGWYIPISLFLSYTFPLAFLFLFPKKAIGDPLLQYTLLLTSMGLLLSIFIGEDGARAHHGNFLWQNYICCYIWMLGTALLLIEIQLKNQTVAWKGYLLLSIYTLHFLAGIGYFLHMGFFNSYY